MKHYWIWKVTVQRQSVDGDFNQVEHLISEHCDLLNVSPDIDALVSAISDCHAYKAERLYRATMVESLEFIKAPEVVELEKIISWCLREAKSERALAKGSFKDDHVQAAGCYSRAMACDCIREKIEKLL